MDYRNDQKTSLYGGLNFKPSDNLSAYVHGGYERYVRNSIDGGCRSQPDGTPRFYRDPSSMARPT